MKSRVRICNYCNKSCMTPCETPKQGSKCSRNRNSKKALKNRSEDKRGK